MLELMLDGMTREPETPEWLRGVEVLLLRRAGELWWTDGGIIVCGAPPVGVRIVPSFQEVPDDYGPSGDPEQIRPQAVHIQDTICLVSEAGGVASLMRGDHFRFLVDYIPTRLLYVRYPWVDGVPQFIAAFAKYLPFGDEAAPVAYKLVALIPPLSIREEDNLTVSELDGLPRMSGIGALERSES